MVPVKFRPYYLSSKGNEPSTHIRVNGTSRPADVKKLRKIELENPNISYDSLRKIVCEYDEGKEFDVSTYEQVDEEYHYLCV